MDLSTWSHDFLLRCFQVCKLYTALLLHFIFKSLRSAWDFKKLHPRKNFQENSFDYIYDVI